MNNQGSSQQLNQLKKQIRYAAIQHAKSLHFLLSCNLTILLIKSFAIGDVESDTLNNSY